MSPGHIAALRGEAGGHRWQRIPPNERKNRVHTSTVTVAVLDAAEVSSATARGDALEVDWDEIDMTFTKKTGPGGQHKNKRDTAVVLVHKPTGVKVTVDGRAQHANRCEAYRILCERVHAQRCKSNLDSLARDRKQQVGSGQRGDKIRTYREQDDRVSDHRRNTVARLKDVEAGKLELLA